MSRRLNISHSGKGDEPPTRARMRVDLLTIIRLKLKGRSLLPSYGSATSRQCRKQSATADTEARCYGFHLESPFQRDEAEPSFGSILDGADQPARRYAALFTLVGIAGADHVDAPDL